jgi:hypothetical protein
MHLLWRLSSGYQDGPNSHQRALPSGKDTICLCIEVGGEDGCLVGFTCTIENVKSKGRHLDWGDEGYQGSKECFCVFDNHLIPTGSEEPYQ